MFTPDYPGAIVVEAANYGYGVPNHPRTWGFHTPEEPADSYPSTPEYLATTDRDASYTYFVSYLGFVFQLVPEGEGAYAHGLEGKPAPHWSDGTNLNLQSLSLSFEGHAATIHQTMPRGCPQWVSGVNLVAHRTKALGLNLGWAFQHKDVSIYRGDCGLFDQAAFIADVRVAMKPTPPPEEDDMPTLKEIVDALSPVIEEKVQEGVKDVIEPLMANQGSVYRRALEALDQFDRKYHRWDDIAKRNRGWRLVKGSADDIYHVTRGQVVHLGSWDRFIYSGYSLDDVETIPDDKLTKILDG